jgi:hypothetical protein
MNAGTTLVFVPTKVVQDARASHKLPYFNNRHFDYAFANFALIPHALGVWAETGIDLSPQFVDKVWKDHAEHREGNQNGERNRACKLLLDALKAFYDVAAFAEFTKCQVMYRPRDDMEGRDLQLLVPNIGPVWLQMRVEIVKNYQRLKLQRQQRRGTLRSDAIDACAYEKDLDKTFQPWLPNQDFYRRTVMNLRSRQENEFLGASRLDGDVDADGIDLVYDPYATTPASTSEQDLLF